MWESLVVVWGLQRGKFIVFFIIILGALCTVDGMKQFGGTFAFYLLLGFAGIWCVWLLLELIIRFCDYLVEKEKQYLSKKNHRQ